jgi:hypothetical protein
MEAVNIAVLFQYGICWNGVDLKYPEIYEQIPNSIGKPSGSK